MEKYGKLSQNYAFYPFIFGALSSVITNLVDHKPEQMFVNFYSSIIGVGGFEYWGRDGGGGAHFSLAVNQSEPPISAK